MPLTSDRTREVTSTTGTGTVTLAGAPSQFQTFATAFPVGSKIMYAIVGQGTSEWEVGEGTLVTSTTLSRDLVRSSSNANALVNFSAGTKDVFATLTGEQAERAGLAMQIAMNNAWALP